MEFVLDQAPLLIRAVPTTVGLWFAAIVIGAILGAGLAVGRVYGGRLTSRFIAGYIDAVRGTPMLVQMFLLYFGLPDLGLVLEPVEAAVAAIGLNSAAYQAEYLRAGIECLPRSQFDAAQALGLSRVKTVWNVILPQAFRLSLPAWSNEVVVELQFSSIAFTIGVVELTGQAEKIGYQTFRFFDAFLLCGVIYAVLTAVVTFLIRQLRRSIAVPGLGAN
jgi:polar amino acid transport system permease protein